MSRPITRSLPAALLILLAALSLPAQAQDVPPPGVITYRLPDGPIYRVIAAEGAQPEDVSARLDDLAPGTEDDWLNVSPDGAWLLVSTDRFDPACVGWPCLALLPPDLSDAESVQINGEPVHASSGFGAVASGGNLIIYADSGGPHFSDLWAISRDSNDGAWTGPVLISERSPYAWNAQPAISEDGTRVVFDCGDEPYGQDGTAICDAATDGSDLIVCLMPQNTPPGFDPGTALHHPDFAPDGSIVFESDWGGLERLWRWLPDEHRAVLITEQFGNDNSPCVLPDGRIVSLWLGHEDNESGVHEIKVMSPDAGEFFMLITGVDVLDAGLGCGAG
jgi:hypothetical protein